MIPAEGFTQPHSHEAEAAVLGALLLDNGAWDMVGDMLTADEFYEPAHRTLFSAIGSMILAGKLADIITVHEATGHSMADLNSYTQSIGSARSARHYASIVRERFLEREVIRLGGEAQQIAIEPGDVREKLDKIQTGFEKLQAGTSKKMPTSLDSLAVRALDRYNEAAEGRGAPSISSGLQHLDRAIRGGFRGGRVYVLAARPSIGKSSLAAQFMVRMAENGHGVLFLSQEMPEDEVTDRVTACMGRISYERLQDGGLVDDDWSRLSEAAERFRGMRIWVDDQPALTLHDIRAKICAVRRHGLGAVIIDYLQLCEPSKRHDTRQQAIGEISRGLKKMAKDFDIPIIALSQLNREVEKRGSPEPNLGDLREAGDIEQDADVVMMLWPFSEFPNYNILGLTLAKNRQGKRGVRLALHFEGEFQRWAQSDADLSSKTTAKKPTNGGFE
jgi:replicative DNA helicase